MEDDLKKNKNGRRPKKKNFKKIFFQFLLNLGAMEDDLKKNKLWKTTSKKK